LVEESGVVGEVGLVAIKDDFLVFVFLESLFDESFLF
jgi:hypothetical protein